MSSVLMPRSWRTRYSSSPKSSPTGPTTRTSVKKLAASEKWTAEPPSIRSRSPNGDLTASKAIDPTTHRLMARGRVPIAGGSAATARSPLPAASVNRAIGAAWCSARAPKHSPPQRRTRVRALGERGVDRDEPHLGRGGESAKAVEPALEARGLARGLRRGLRAGGERDGALRRLASEAHACEAGGHAACGDRGDERVLRCREPALVLGEPSGPRLGRARSEPAAGDRSEPERVDDAIAPPRAVHELAALARVGEPGDRGVERIAPVQRAAEEPGRAQVVRGADELSGKVGRPSRGHARDDLPARRPTYAARRRRRVVGDDRSPRRATAASLTLG